MEILFDLVVVFLPVETCLYKVGRFGKQSGHSVTTMDIWVKFRGSARSEEVVDLEVCGPNIACYDRLDRDAYEQIERCSDGEGRVRHLFLVGKVMELRAECVVALEEWYAYCVDSPAGQCRALETLWQDMRDDVLKELVG